MKNAIATRCFSVTLAVINATVAVCIGMMSRLNALDDWSNALVSIVGPAATVVYTMLAIAWLLDAIRPGVLRRFLPGAKEPEAPVFDFISETVPAPMPLPDTFGERCKELVWRAATYPVHAVLGAAGRDRGR